MQTFLPYDDFKACAKVLDPVRGRKQIIEAKQIILVLLGGSFVEYRGQRIKVSDGGLPHHPVVDMWRGHELELALYGIAFHDEFGGNGYRAARFLFDEMVRIVGDGQVVMPRWMGDPDFHSAHRAMLLKKDAEFYGDHGWTDTAEDYIWPKA